MVVGRCNIMVDASFDVFISCSFDVHLTRMEMMVMSDEEEDLLKVTLAVGAFEYEPTSMTLDSPRRI